MSLQQALLLLLEKSSVIIKFNLNGLLRGDYSGRMKGYSTGIQNGFLSVNDVAASQIYVMLTDYKGNITVKIDGIAASAASVIAMAGTQALMAPTALMKVHNPLTIAIGDSEEMQRAIDMLAAVKESIINAYQIKSEQGRAKLSNLMDAETCPAHAVIEMCFADGILEDSKRGADGMVSAEDSAVYDKMESDMVALGKEIEKLERQAAHDLEMSKPTSQPVTNAPAKPDVQKNARESNEYKEDFEAERLERSVPVAAERSSRGT